MANAPSVSDPGKRKSAFASLAFGAAFSASLVTVTQPVFVLRVSKQAALPGVSYRHLFTRIIEFHGYQGLWNAYGLALLDSLAARGVKTLVYGKADEFNVNPFFKAIGSSILFSATNTPFERLNTPFERLSCVMITHGNKSKLDMIRSVVKLGPRELYSGFSMSLLRNLIEASSMFGFRSAQKHFKKVDNTGLTSRATIREAVAVAACASVVKVAATNFTDVVRVEQQKQLQKSGQSITLRTVFAVKGPRHFFTAGSIPSLVLNFVSILGYVAWMEYSES